MKGLKKIGAKKIIFFLTIIYLVGLVGLIYPPTRTLTASLTVANLLLAFGLLIGWEYPWSKARWIAVLIPFTGGFFAEWLGVHTGLLFGNYDYGEALGWKIQGIPIMIGVNWVLMVWMTQVLWRTIEHKWRPLLAAGTMTAYDVLLEQVAIRFDYWHWAGGTIPMFNYVCWFGLAFVFHWGFQKISPPRANPIALAVFFLQVFFFASLNLVFILSPKLGF